MREALWLLFSHPPYQIPGDGREEILCNEPGLRPLMAVCTDSQMPGRACVLHPNLSQGHSGGFALWGPGTLLELGCGWPLSSLTPSRPRSCTEEGPGQSFADLRPAGNTWPRGCHPPAGASSGSSAFPPLRSCEARCPLGPSGPRGRVSRARVSEGDDGRGRDAENRSQQAPGEEAALARAENSPRAGSRA